MNKEKIYFNLGIIAFQFGACMIPLGLRSHGAWWLADIWGFHRV